MNCDFMVACDFAQNFGRKVNLLGIFDTIYTDSVPAVHPLFCVVIRVRVKKEEVGKHHIVLSLVNSAGEDIMEPIISDSNIEFRKNGDGVISNVYSLYGLLFKNYDSYFIKLSVDGEVLATETLHVMKE